MKQIIAVAALFALAACGGSDAGEEGAVAEDEAGNPAIPATSAGTYVGTDGAGGEVTFVLNADGTFEHREGGEVARTGTWEDNIRGTCFIEEGVEFDQCYNIVPVGDDGTVDVTGPDGVTMSMTRTD